MANKYYNITGSTGTTVELIEPGTYNSSVRSIMITNTHASDDATVTLFIEDEPEGATTAKFKIINAIAIPAKTSLLLDNTSLLSVNFKKYGLYAIVGSSDTLDILINS